MLQIISGKFFTTDNRHHTPCKGVLFSNAQCFSSINLDYIQIDSASNEGEVSTYVVSYDNQIEKQEQTSGFSFVKIGDEQILHQLKLIISFSLNAFFDEDKQVLSTFWDTLYYSGITFLTIVYGDISPAFKKSIRLRFV